MARATKPDNLLIYYGWLNSYNSAQNQWNNEKVAQDLAKADILVLGDGIQNPSHGDYSNTSVIIPRVIALNPDIKVFGYVTINQDLSTFKTKAKQWDDLNVQGIFLDEAGYDYGKKREEFNERVAFVNSLDSACICFANAWNLDHILGTANDTNYPNATYNPNGVESLLTEGDYVLLESFSVNTDAYTSNSGYAPKSDWIARGEKAQTVKDEFGVNIATVGIVNIGNQNEQGMFDFSYRSTLVFGFEANGVSDSSYGASSAKGKVYTPTTIADLGNAEISVELDASDNDVYLCYGERVKVSIDHSTGAQTSSVTSW